LKLSLLPAIIGILFTDLFDSISTFIGVAHAAELLDEEGNPKNLKQGLIVDSFATLGAGLAGTSSGTAYIESIAGINMGGAHRTDFGIHGALFPAVLFPCTARWDGAGLCNRLRLDPCRCVDVSECRQDFVFEIRGRLASVLNHNSHPPNFFNHAGHPLGLHFARRTLSDCRPATRDSSNDVCTGFGVDRAFVVGACEVCRLLRREEAESDLSVKVFGSGQASGNTFRTVVD
jgi:hypothetical protein